MPSATPHLHRCTGLPASQTVCTQGKHYLGGRFVPPEIRERFNLQLPEYAGTAQCTKLPSSGAGTGVNVADMRQSDSNMGGGIDEASIAGVCRHN